MVAVMTERRAEHAAGAPPLREGPLLRCPHCRRAADEQAFVRLGCHPDFVQQTVPVWRCPYCRRHFALRERAAPAREEM